MARLNSRERLQAALDHREADGVPVDLSATTSSGISVVAYDALKRRLGLAGPIRVMDVVQQLALPDDAVLERCRVDVVNVGRVYNTASSDWRDFVLPGEIAVQVPAWFRPLRQANGILDLRSEDGVCIGTMVPGATFFDQIYYPYEDGYPADFAGLPAALDRIHWSACPVAPWDHSREAGFWAELRDRTLALLRESERGLVVAAAGKLVEWGFFLRRMDNFLADLVLETAAVERLCDVLLERQLATLAHLCEAVGDLVDVIRFGDDLGMDSGPLMSRRTYQRIFKPRHAQLCRYVKAHSRAHILLHSCGSIYPLIPDLIDAGFDAINPVQISSRNMEPERLKREFGRDLVLWGGGADTRRVLNQAGPAEVREHVMRNLDIMAPGGGFVFCAVHNIMPDVPADNVLAMFDAVAEFNGSRQRAKTGGRRPQGE